MNCDEVRPVLLDYVMDEAAQQDCEAIARHLETCAACSEEAGRLRQTLGHLAQGAVFEDIPQKIRLVAEPSNWWRAWWLNPARLAFAGGALACLAVALLALAHTTISYQQGKFDIAFGAATRSVSTPVAAPVSVAALAKDSLTREQVERLIAAAVAASEAREADSAARLVKAVSAQAERDRTNDRRELAESFRYVQAAQVNMWKQQVENQQDLATLAERAGVGMPPRP